MSEERAVARRAGVVGAATMISRVLGLVREQVMASWFGAGLASDAFNVAFRIPNLLRDLFAEGAMSSAFVPTFTRRVELEGPDAAWRLGRQLMTVLALVLGVISALGFAFAPWLVAAFAPGFAAVPGKLELTVQLTRIMLPFLPAVALASACMGMLNARGHFAVPALAPALLNLGMVVFGLGLIPVFRHFGQPAIVAMAVGVVIGGALQFAVQIPVLHAMGFRLLPEWPRQGSGVGRIGRLMVPSAIGQGATQLNLFFSTLIASWLPQGSVSWLMYAFRLMQLPIGVFGVALGTVSLPAMSRAAVAKDMTAFRTTFSATLRLVLVLTLPAALWLAAVAPQLVALLYEHGRFGIVDTERTAQALRMYCVGLPAFAASGVLTRAFFALGDTRTPVQASFVSVALNLLLNLALMRPLGHLGLALATSITSIASLAQLVLYLRRRLGALEGGRIANTFVRTLLASAAIAVPLAFALPVLAERLPRNAASDLTVVAAALLAGGLGLYAAMRVARVEELAVVDDLMGGLRRRLGM